jgi:hypothetical protein
MRSFHFSNLIIAVAWGIAAALALIISTGRSVAAGSDRQTVAALAEEDLPPANGDASGSANGASAAPEQRDHTDDWQRLPEGANDSGAAQTAPATGAPPDQVQPQSAAPDEAEQSSGAIQQTPQPMSIHRVQAKPVALRSVAGASMTPGPALATPAAQPSDSAKTGPPPALDVSTITTSPDLGTIALDHEIRQALSPSRAASLRLTEQARKELATGAMDVALRDLGRAVSIDAGDPFEYYYLGRAYFLRGNYPQAPTFFQRSRLGFGGRPEWLGETLSYEGMCDEELGKPADAAKAYQRAVSIAPGNFRARIGYRRLSASIAPATSLDAPPPDAQAAPEAPSGDAAVPPPAQSSAPQSE